MGFVAVCGHLDGVVCSLHWGWFRNFSATVGRSDCNYGLYFSFFYLPLKRGLIHSDVGAMVPTAVVGMASTVFTVEVAGTQLFVAVAVFGTLMLLVRIIKCAAEVVVHIQAALVPL